MVAILLRKFVPDILGKEVEKTLILDYDLGLCYIFLAKIDVVSSYSLSNLTIYHLRRCN